MKPKLLAGALATCAVLSLVSAASEAHILNPGDAGITPHALTISPDFTILDFVSQPVVSSVPADFFGNLFEAVISDPANVFGAGDLDFVVSVENDASFNSIERVTASAFATIFPRVVFKTDVGYLAGSPGVLPTTVDRLSPFEIGFNFADGIAPGQTSTDLIIETNATRFTSGTLSAFNSGSATITAFAPAAVPELSTWLMVGLGFMGLGLLRMTGKAGQRGRLQRKPSDA